MAATVVHTPGARYPFKPQCECGAPFRGYAAEHAAQTIAADHKCVPTITGTRVQCDAHGVDVTFDTAEAATARLRQHEADETHFYPARVARSDEYPELRNVLRLT